MKTLLSASILLLAPALSGQTIVTTLPATCRAGALYALKPAAPSTSYTYWGCNTDGKTYTQIQTCSGPTCQQPPIPPTSTMITLPIEVLGANGTTAAITFTPAVTTNLGAGVTMNLTIHNLRYNGEVTVQVNNSTFPVNSTSATVLGLGANYGGIGGAFSTLNLQMSIPANTLVAGSNKVTFQFVTTDGVVSGFRVLAVNFTDAGGNTLIPASSFVWDDPSKWVPPSTAPADIAAGLNLFQTAALVDSVAGPNPNFKFAAHCMDCHFSDGSDLQYMGYSNNSIITRSVYHGLTPAQGSQIASYIRSLSSKIAVTGRPWNPPFQPGPGLDALPVQSWMAGAGLSAALADDTAMVPYLAPGGDTSLWSPAAFMNQRQTPVPMILPDWNHYLPRIHPMDAWGTAFTGSQLLAYYQGLKSMFAAPNGVASFINGGYFNMQSMTTEAHNLKSLEQKPSADPAWSTPSYVDSLTGIMRWAMMKDLELYFQNNLWDTSVASKVFSTPDAAARAIQWGALPFNESSNMIQIPIANNLNGLKGSFNGESMAWYYVQLLTNDGNQRGPGIPSVDDMGYVSNFLNGSTWSIEKPLPTGVQQLYWLIKTLQIYNGNDPSYGNSGWNFNNNRAYYLTIGQNIFPPSVSRIPLFNAYLKQWIRATTSFTNAQWLAGAANGYGPVPETDVITPGNPQGVQAGGGSGIANMLPVMKFLGADQPTLQAIANWAATIWTTYDWNGRLNAACTPSGDIASCP